MATGDQSMESNEKVQGSCNNEDALQDFTKDELIKAISKYKIQVEEMKNQLHTLISDKPDFVIRKENSMLQKRNKILVSTNTSMSRQIANKMTELKELQNQNEDLQTQINTTQSNDNSTIPAENHSALKEKCAEMQNEIMEMRGYLKHYYESNSKLQQNLQEHKNNYNKLIASLSVLVKERDELRNKLEIAQKNPTMCSAPYNEIGDMAKKQCEVLEERCRVAEAEICKCEKALSSKDYHIQEQEVRIESLMKKLGIYGRDAEENAGKDRTIARLNKEASLLELEVKTLKEKIENQDSAEHDKEFVQQQLKAFQDDWSAENEEKAQIMQEKRMLENDNKMLRKQLSETHPYPQYPIGGYGSLSPQSPPLHPSHQEPLESVAPNSAVVPSQPPLVPTSTFAPAHGPSSQVHSQPYVQYMPGVPGQYNRSQSLQAAYYTTPHNQYIGPRYSPPNNVAGSPPESNTPHETNYIPNQPARRS